MYPPPSPPGCNADAAAVTYGRRRRTGYASESRSSSLPRVRRRPPSQTTATPIQIRCRCCCFGIRNCLRYFQLVFFCLFHLLHSVLQVFPEASGDFCLPKLRHLFEQAFFVRSKPVLALKKHDTVSQTVTCGSVTVGS